MELKNEIIIYQTNELNKIEVQIDDDTVWLTQAQMARLFNQTKQNISLHINNCFKEKELEKEATVKESLTAQNEGGRAVKRKIEYYNLDVIISVGYRVKSKQGTQFRIWANKILKDYLLKGYAVNERLNRMENRVNAISDKVDSIDLQINTSLPPRQGIFFNGQIFDAYTFVSDLIRTATKSIDLIDNYVDDTVLVLLQKRAEGVSVCIHTKNIGKQLTQDIDKHNAQYPRIELKQFKDSHDRFLIIDNTTVYHLGASIKDIGKKWFAFTKIDGFIDEIIRKLKMGGGDVQKLSNGGL